MSLIHPENHFAIFALLLGTSVLGMWAEGKKWAFNIAGVVITIFATMVVVLIGILPPAFDADHPVAVYDFVFDYFVPISIPLLLFNANLKRIFRESGKMILAYLIGALGVIIGAFVAFFLVPIPGEGAKMAGVFTGTFIGGSMNFIGTADVFEFAQSSRFVTAQAVDQFTFSLYVALLFSLPAFQLVQRWFIVESREGQVEGNASIPKSHPDAEITMEYLAQALGIAGAIAGLSFYITPWLQALLNTELNLNILVITLMITTLANIFPRYMQKLDYAAFSTGFLLIYIFLAVLGAGTHPNQILATGPEVLMMAVVILLVHLIILLLLGRAFNIGIKTLAIASTANIGGPSVAAPMAAAFGLPRMVTPAILVGILGYIIGTFLGVWVGVTLQ